LTAALVHSGKLLIALNTDYQHLTVKLYITLASNYSPQRFDTVVRLPTQKTTAATSMGKQKNLEQL